MHVHKLNCKARIHELHADRQTLRAATYKIQANSHALVADRHRLLAQSFALRASRRDDLQLNYELQQRYHILQAEQHLDRARGCQLKSVESQMKAMAHQTLAQHLHTTARQINLATASD